MTNAVVVTDANFASEVEGHEGLVVLDFQAAWCGPCRAMAPVVDRLADEYDGRVKFAKLDIDTNADVANRFGVRSIPTLLFFVNGKLVDRSIGAAPKILLGMKIEEHLPSLAAEKRQPAARQVVADADSRAMDRRSMAGRGS